MISSTLTMLLLIMTTNRGLKLTTIRPNDYVTKLDEYELVNDLDRAFHGHLPIQFHAVWMDYKHSWDERNRPITIITLKAGLIWNGANIIPDSLTNLRAALWHDAWYSMLEERVLPAKRKWRKFADTDYIMLYHEDARETMHEKEYKRWRWYINVQYAFLRLFGWRNCGLSWYQ